MAAEKRLHAVIRGGVQGVFYRKFTETEALKLNLKGYVRNMPDGSVEVVAEGNEKKLSLLLRRLYEGPAAAQVTGVEKEITEAKGGFTTFSVKF
jgi:acylphosphatase